jgi:tRNA/tmRNA/rRNA uracil-C5-methylase (TrmA/RlmC/RlmD family)
VLSCGRVVRTPLSDIWEIDGEIITGDREVRIGDYVLSTGAFFQVNRHLLGTLIDLVTGHAARCRSRKSAIDLYAGVGYFSAPMARQFERVVAVEGSALSHRWCEVNVPENVECVHAPVEQWPMHDADFIFLDPPRAGARRQVIDGVAQHAREMVCYLSCDPVTFARDASRLIASGWRLATLDLLDLFPNTHHVETLASFERAG